MKNAFLIIAILLLSGCKPEVTKVPEKHENVNEEVKVILNTFSNGIVWVSKNDFKEMHAKNHNLQHKKVNRIRKYTTTDSLLSMNDFKSLDYQETKKKLNGTVAYSFKALKESNLNGYEIIKENIMVARKDSNYNGNLTFSRVIFNKQRNKAKYYFEQYKVVGERRGWGTGTYIYAKKVNGVWVFDKKEEAWIT